MYVHPVAYENISNLDMLLEILGICEPSKVSFCADHKYRRIIILDYIDNDMNDKLRNIFKVPYGCNLVLHYSFNIEYNEKDIKVYNLLYKKYWKKEK